MPVPIVFHPAYEATLPAGHRFPMRKYGRLAEVLQEGGLAPGGFVRPEPAPAEVIALAHERAYVDLVLAGAVPREIERRIGLPVDEGVARRACASAGDRAAGRSQVVVMSTQARSAPARSRRPSSPAPR